MISPTSNTTTPLSQSTTSANTNSTASFQAHLDEFYEIHQRSQITGVPTSIYKASLANLGLDTEDTWAGMKAINLLKEHGYNTGKPSDEAILKYGNTDQEHGNKSYMKNGTTEPTLELASDIQALNEEFEGAYEGARNYYDIAVIRSGENVAVPVSTNISEVSSMPTSHMASPKAETEAVQPTNSTPTASTTDTLSLMIKQLDTLSPKETMGLLEAFLKKLG